MNKRFAILIVMLLGFALNAFVPKGFMPSFDADGKVAIQICSGMDGSVKTIYVDGEQEQSDDTHINKDKCPYALALNKHFDVPVYDAALQAPLFSFQQSFINTHIARRILTNASHSRGPPSFS
ncbi:MAG: hypothetical protein CMH32_00770 [Micavibrio sp.]|nr:hypothetical protein [Micavibrio sp.]HCK33328.1 hypothetical protein [Rhodospirillaceae bacterium]|tara:strand:- start:712 stop:1080 length:369 start_codon:yes stop_codon:yes gene_type:complete